MAAPVHQDNYYWCIKDHKALTIWVSLNRATEKNGGVFYFNGSHKYGIFDHEPSFKKGSSQKVKNLEKMKNRFSIETPELNPGDCLVHHCLTVHGSNKNISNYSRKGFTFQFVDFKSKLDVKQKKIYEKISIQTTKIKKKLNLMPGFEIINYKEKKAINDIFDKNGGVLFAHGYEKLRKKFHVREFEKNISRKFKIKNSLVVSSGTAAIKIALKSLGIKSGDEVITQSFNFIATIEAIIDTGAKPIICGIDKNLNMDINDLKKKISKKTKAIIPVHMLGQICRD